MLLNDNKGSFGMFSRAGRSSAEKYNILVRKDEILSGINRKIKLRDLFTPDDHEKEIDEEEDDIDIFKTEGTHRRNETTAGVKPHKKKTQKQKNEITKYLEGRKKIKKKMDNPACTKYNPKNEYIWKRTIIGPGWDQSLPKNFSKVQKEEIDPKFYKFHEDFKVDGKNFIDLARQTRRSSFSGNNNIRIRNIKSSNEPPRKMTHTYQNKTQSNSPAKGQTTTGFFNRPSLNIHNKYNQSAIIINTFSSSEQSEVITDNKKKTKRNSVTREPKLHSGTNRWIKMQAPDFKKIISREQMEKIYGDKRTVIPFSFPNFKWTRSRPIMMVKYDRAVYKKNQDNRPKTSDPFTLNADYDPHKVLDKINNFKAVVSPNFDLMTSRPNDPDPLPSYMKKIYSRQATEMMTEKALKMNNFSEGKFSASGTSFWPKKSFNKIINLNLLNSAKFKENVGLRNIDEENRVNEVNDYIQKSMKFYNKNYDDLMKESMLNKFDNVTFKTIKRENKLETGELEKFLINFEKIDA